MYRRRYYLNCRFSLILNLLRVFTRLMSLGRAFKVRAPFILKKPWYLVVFCERRAQKITPCGVIATEKVRVPKL